MKIKKGTYRIVFIFNKFVVKIPKFHIKAGIEQLHICYKIKRLKNVWQWGSSSYSGCMRWFFGGIADNWQEYRFYSKTKLAILMPTYFSLLGLLNIQKRGQTLKMDSFDLWCHLCDLTNEDVWDDNHTFVNPKNFCVEDGVLKIIDYPKATHRVLKTYGERIEREFDFSYDYEKERG